ncbi:MAG TPA: hypothetical protein PK819_03060 [Thermomicrobiales bacterium]|nr:hypothetical protein [Thermomicrobiales bacterium]
MIVAGAVLLYQGQFRPMYLWTDFNACHTMIRICLLDFHPTVRAVLCLRLALEPDLVVLDDASCGLDSAAPSADIVILDLAIPLADQETANTLLAPITTQCPVIVLSLYDDPTTRSLALAAGAARVISKHAEDDLLVSTIRVLANQFQ